MMLRFTHREQTLRTARAVGAVGFIVCRWLLTVCNVPAICGWLENGSSLAAVVYVGAVLWAPSISAFGGPVLGRIGTRLLALTCAANLAAALLSVATASSVSVSPASLGESSGLAIVVNGLDWVAWMWVLSATLALARWLWRTEPETSVGTRHLALRHASLSVFILLILGLQFWVFATGSRTLWPFQDYPLYTASFQTVRAVHYRLYGLTANEPHVFVEISPEALKESFFVHHTQFIPRLYGNPSLDLEDFHRRLDDSDLPTFQLLLAERTTFGLSDSKLVEFAEHRLVWLEPEDLDP